MLLYVMCKACLAPMSDDERNEHEDHVTVTGETVQLVTCSKGHEFGIALQQPMHVLLFERALYRFAKESLRDGFLDAYTAFEMYLSHVPVRARYDRELDASPKTIRDQLGKYIRYAVPAESAACAAFSMVTKRAVPRIDTDVSNLRNEAVHAGTYPDPEKALKFIGQIADTIRIFENGLAEQACVNETTYFEKVFAERRAEGIARLKRPDVKFPSAWINALLDQPDGLPADRINEYRNGLLPKLVG